MKIRLFSQCETAFFFGEKSSKTDAFLLAKSTPRARLFWKGNLVPQFFPRGYFFSAKQIPATALATWLATPSPPELQSTTTVSPSSGNRRFAAAKPDVLPG